VQPSHCVCNKTPPIEKTVYGLTFGLSAGNARHGNFVPGHFELFRNHFRRTGTRLPRPPAPNVLIDSEN